MSDVLIHKTLPVELNNGNDGRGTRWFSSANARKKIEKVLRGEDLERKPFEFPVCLHVCRVLGKGQRFWDPDSVLRGNAKELIDALVSIGWFHDDSIKWIAEVTSGQDASQRGNGPAVIVEVTKA